MLTLESILVLVILILAAIYSTSRLANCKTFIFYFFVISFSWILSSISSVVVAVLTTLVIGLVTSASSLVLVVVNLIVWNLASSPTTGSNSVIVRSPLPITLVFINILQLINLILRFSIGTVQFLVPFFQKFPLQIFKLLFKLFILLNKVFLKN